MTVTVADGCGNIGSVSGFDNAGTQPNTSRLVVDTVAPRNTLDGIANGTTFEAGDDADGDASSGFQVDLGVLFTPFDSIKAGKSIDVAINGAPTTTSPSPILVQPVTAPSIPVQVTIGPEMRSLRRQPMSVEMLGRPHR